jgi:hypothetical protein
MAVQFKIAGLIFIKIVLPLIYNPNFLLAKPNHRAVDWLPPQKTPKGHTNGSIFINILPPIEI